MTEPEDKVIAAMLAKPPTLRPEEFALVRDLIIELRRVAAQGAPLGVGVRLAPALVEALPLVLSMGLASFAVLQQQKGGKD